MLSSGMRQGVCALLCGVASSAIGGAAWAQDARGVAVEELIVTAQKRAEKLQDVPLAISAYTSKDIERSGIQDLHDVAALTPGLSFVTLLGSTSATPVIRGQSTLIGEPNVGVFLDGVYQSSRASMDSLIGDIERIEIVKGPQSALYGRNTFAGAVNYITREPGDTFSGMAEATFGNFKKAEVRASVSGPIVADKLFFRAGGLVSKRGGFYTNHLTGGDLDKRDTRAAYGSLVWRAADNLKFRLSDVFERTRDGDTAQIFIRNNCGYYAPRKMYQFYCGTLPEVTDGFAVTRGFFHRTNNNLSLTTTWEGRGVEVVSISGLNKLRLRSAADNDYSARDIHYRNDAIDQTETSQELRIQSTSGGPLHWLAGLYYYDLDYDGDSTDRFVGLGAGLGGARVINHDTTRNYAGFGQLSYTFQERLTIALSGRYSSEKKTTYIREFTVANGAQVTNLHLADTFSSFTPKVAVDYRFSRDLMAYASVARAVKSGGFNNTNLSGPIQPNERTYRPEKSWTYEAGVKSTWADGRLIANADVFMIKWTDQIVRNLGSAGAILNSNAGRTTSKGFEAELRWRPTSEWSLSANYAYTDAKFDRYNFTALFLLTGHNPDLSGARLQYYPTQALNLSADYTTEAWDDWRWFAYADYSRQSSLESSPTNDGPYKGISRVNLRGGLENNRYAVTLWVKNLTRDKALGNGVLTTNYAQRYDAVKGVEPGPEVLSPLLTAGEPRQVGVTVRARF